MKALATEKNILTPQTKKVTTTLFDLISDMQEDTTATTDDAMIVQIVAEWIRSGRIQFHSNMPEKTAA